MQSGTWFSWKLLFDTNTIVFLSLVRITRGYSRRFWIPCLINWQSSTKEQVLHYAVNIVDVIMFERWIAGLIGFCQLHTFMCFICLTFTPGCHCHVYFFFFYINPMLFVDDQVLIIGKWRHLVNVRLDFLVLNFVKEVSQNHFTPVRIRYLVTAAECVRGERKPGNGNQNFQVVSTFLSCLSTSLSICKCCFSTSDVHSRLLISIVGNHHGKILNMKRQ